jgi:hypothetical protein
MSYRYASVPSFALAVLCGAGVSLFTVDASADGTEDPTVSVSPPPPAPKPVDRTEPRWNGRGLIIGAGVAGGAGFALNAGRIAWHLSTCRPRHDVLDYAGGCLVSAWGDVFLSIPAWFANMASIGMAGGGGALRGRHDAWAGKKRDSRRAIIAGATMVGVGATAYLVARLARFAAIGCIDNGLGCYRGVYIGTTAGIQLGLTTAAVGAGILALGAEYKRHKRKYDLQVAPQVSGNYTGIAIAGRF